ncbi:uncharacterized protein BP01DRAFT_415135 [Aspergillus saccharolyticus JOP 1030-1]|uniref:Uncharacterized protein n=1 Tax=Aspergillus saccharolyticus JOP 1030-1 TaxID=1450539 RepID=A0A318ZK06_9EURO|nr:hypothetical protein BP01DRAFT_415135 [Aspergillus saccharolyticus JOP 1030-1]PYH46704.1 hypothetical protein BP01DRAFT_415135 [Aspergillus saccharolyticus JOP 1030-1]
MALQSGCADINRGRKRPAETDPDIDHQPLAKKFSHLHLSISTRERLASSSDGDQMMLDDTKHTIYIHDMDTELADIENMDNQVTILSGVVDALSAVSRMLVTNDKAQCKELVLYREPTSLTTPAESENVRKALIATRERARKSSHLKHDHDYVSPCESHVVRFCEGKGDADAGHLAFGEKMDIDVTNPL